MRTAASLGVAIATLCALTPSAYAALHPTVDAEFDKIVEFNYRGSAQSAPPTCSTLCQELRAAETRPGGWSTPAVEQLNREARTLRVSTGLTNAIRLGSSFTLGLTAFDVGYQIGSGINAKFLRIGLPAKSPNLSAAPQRLIFASSCSPSSPCSIGSIYHDRATITRPAYIWLWDANWDSPYGANWWDWRSNDGNCQHPSPPPDAPNVLESVASSSTCNGDPDLSGTTTSAWWYTDDLAATTPIQDYTGQPSNYQDWWPPADPGFSTVRTRTRSELESNRYPLLNQQMEFETGVPGACDPRDPDVCNPPEANRADERKCELGEPDDEDPDDSVSKDQFAAGQYATVTSFTRRHETSGNLVPTALKVGWTRPHAKKGWAGWGWRHVAARHGWTEYDIEATEEALLATPFQDGGWVYLGEEYEQDGAKCQRRVVVSPAVTSPAEPEPKEVITSYGEYIGPAG